MNTKMVKIGAIMMFVSGIGLGVMAVVSECQRHKTKQKLIATEAKLWMTDLNNFVKDRKIRELEDRLEKYENVCEGEGS